MLVGIERAAAKSGQERLEILAALPHRPRAGQRADPDRPRGVVEPRHRLEAGAEVGDVEIVGEAIAGNGVAGGVDIDPAMAPVSDQPDEACRVAESRHVLLVLAAGPPRRRRGADPDRVVGTLDQEPVTVGPLGELV